jgi:diguanylate cyclase (GGDEF)-like protein
MLPGRTRDGAPNILLIGTVPEVFGNLQQRAGLQCKHVASFVEAILAVFPDDHDGPYSLIVAGVAQDQPTLEAAIAALRDVHPAGRLVLVCEAYEEPQCRRLIGAGADDYLVLPVSEEQIIALAAPPQAEPLPQIRLDVSSPPSRNGHAAATRDEIPAARAIQGKTFAPAGDNEADEFAQLQLLSLPVVVQAALMNEVLENTGDLHSRALATLQSYFTWPGKLQIVSGLLADAGPQPNTWVEPLKNHDTDFGHLTLEHTAASETLRDQFSQAALWLSGWMTLAQRTRQLRELATTDELSGAYNRRYFMHFVTQLLEKARVGRFRVSLLYFDIDDFKHYNDKYGHAAGDSIIRELIRLLRHCTRPHDLVARIGGDEFAVVFWDNEPPRQANSQHPKSAIAITERFRKAVASCDWQKVSNISGQVSVSGGLATFPWDARSLDALMAAADANLLKAKQQGKNLIVLREPDEEPPCADDP